MKKSLKALAAVMSILLTVTLVAGLCTVSFGALVSENVFVSDYTCNFESNYYQFLGNDTCTDGVVTDGENGKALKFTVSSSTQSARFEVYNSEAGDLLLADNSVYAVTVKYKVEQIGGSDSSAATYLNLVRYSGKGDTLVKIDALPESVYYPGDTTEWITASAIFKTGEVAASGYNHLAVNVISNSCPSMSSNSNSDKTVILFDEIKVVRCSGSANGLTFISNGGSTVEPILALSGDGITLPTPERPLYDFAGWYTDLGLTNEFKQTSMPSTFSTKLYAKWTPSADASVIGFVTNSDDTVEPLVGKAGDSVTLPKITREGFRFAGWYTSAEYKERCETTVYPSESITLYAKWEAIPIYCGFENSSAFPDPDNGKFTMRCIITDEQKSNGEKSLHYSFQRGFELSGSAGKSTPAGVLLIDESGEYIRLEKGKKYTVSFKYKVLEYKSAKAVITLIASGSSGAWDNRAVQKCEVGYDASDVGKGWQSHTFELEWNPSSKNANYISIGISGESVICVDDIIICAYDEDFSYPGGMMLCFETGDGPAVDTVYGDFGTEITLPEPEREGYRFIGWSYDEMGEHSVTSDTFKLEKMYNVLYADWYKIPEKTESPSDTPNEPTDSAPVAAEKSGIGTVTVIIIVIVAVVIVAAAVITVVLIKRRKKETDKA